MQPKTREQSIIFDLTGVLFHLDFIGLCRAMGLWPLTRYLITHWRNPATTCFKLLQKIHERENTQYPVIYYKGYALPDAISACMHGTISNTDAIRIVTQQVKELVQPKDFASTFEQHFIANMITNSIFNAQSLIPHTKPIDQTVALAKQIKQNQTHKLYALSNMDHETFRALSDRYPYLFDLFDGVVISAQVQKIKPYKQIYEHLLTTYSLDPHHCLFIDDQGENIVAAQEQGITGIIYTSPKQLHKQLKERQIL